MAFSNDIKVFARSWRQHFAMQFTTAVVLTATFTVVGFMLSLSMNLKRVLSVWGERVQISLYLEDTASDVVVQALKTKLTENPLVGEVEYTTKKRAAEIFRDQMASYAPDLMDDAEFATPFPASFQVRLKDGLETESRVQNLEALAKTFSAYDGVEDVSYGQSWVKNYASFVAVLQGAGSIIAIILVLGSMFVIGNSIRTLISARRDEIEILELVGASSAHVRRPFLTEGALLGFMSAALALFLNAGLYSWQTTVMRRSLAFARMAVEFQFLSVGMIVLFLFTATVFGILGAWITVRSLNDGWSAARGAQSQ